MPSEGQDAAVAFLTGSLSRTGKVDTVTTHISRIFLGRDRVFKLKRAVRFPYLDFSTPERRLAACAAEVALNSRTAPTLYLGVHRITREPDDTLTFDGAGELIDAAVAMRRFPEADLFDTMARDGRLQPGHVAELASVLAAFHDAAEVHHDRGGAAAMGEVLAMNEVGLRASGLISAARAEALTARFRVILNRHAGLLDRRRAAGKVRRCHGDLILRNICLFEGRPTPFDAIEFSEVLATVDVLYDLAFLLMDLWHRDRFELANHLFNRYLDAADEADGIGLLPFMMAVRAAIRAHVTAAQVEGAEGAAGIRAEALAYVDLAEKLLTDAPAGLLAVGGFSGSGKSSVAAAAAAWIGAAPGARIVSSDRIRKRLHGVGALTRLPASAYDPAMSERVYGTMRDEAGRILASGQGVVADAVFDRPPERAAIEAVARAKGVWFCGIWLEAPIATLGRRIHARIDDPSDATAAVLAGQVVRGCGPVTWRRLDSDRPLEVLRSGVTTILRSKSASSTAARCAGSRWRLRRRRWCARATR